jgi:hypothetical protein
MPSLKHTDPEERERFHRGCVKIYMRAEITIQYMVNLEI